MRSLLGAQIVATDTEAHMGKQADYGPMVATIVNAIQDIPPKRWQGGLVQLDVSSTNGYCAHICLFSRLDGTAVGVIRAAKGSPSLPKELLKQVASGIYWRGMGRTDQVRDSWLSFIIRL